mmetsp:Transcript_8990/g.26135  ORF Transcript_8990/g.26135 Transcript_8990/m.26135 type:complete len:265 (+) Transcript_8990:193-987(+)
MLRPATVYRVAPGRPVCYLSALAVQRALQKQRLGWQRLGEVGRDVLLLLEHEPVYTFGRRGRPQDLRVCLGGATHEAFEQRLKAGPVEHGGRLFVKTDRGGKITWHGPGQLVGYLVLDLSHHTRDLHWYLDGVEEIVKRTLKGYGLAPRSDDEHTGVWVGDEKAAAIGINAARWVTIHGFALNVQPDMASFDVIVPCGIEDFGVTSMEQLMTSQQCPGLGDVAAAVTGHAADVFTLDVEEREVDALDEIVEAEGLSRDCLEEVG